MRATVNENFRGSCREIRDFTLPAMALAVCLCAGCSTGTSDTSQPTASVSYELVTIQDQALSEIRATQTVFEVSQRDDVRYWSRARLFLEVYTASKSLEIESLAGEGVRYSNRLSTADRFLYGIEKHPDESGFVYRVYCKPSSSATVVALDQAALNAQNLARFIQRGQLELSLLDR